MNQYTIQYFDGNGVTRLMTFTDIERAWKAFFILQKKGAEPTHPFMPQEPESVSHRHFSTPIIDNFDRSLETPLTTESTGMMLDYTSTYHQRNGFEVEDIWWAQNNKFCTGGVFGGGIDEGGIYLLIQPQSIFSNPIKAYIDDMRPEWEAIDRPQKILMA